MGLLRNFIDISGITPEEDLPSKVRGQLLEYSEIEHFYIPEDKPGVKDIYQISVKVELVSTRTINSPLGKIIVLDGMKKIKVIYTSCSHQDAASFVDIELPFNTFIDIPKESSEVEHANIYIADAYFKAIDSKKLYSFLLYIIDVDYDKSEKIEEKKKNILKLKANNNLETINYPKETDEKESAIGVTSLILNEVSLSKDTNNIENNLNELLVDEDSEYL